jgi:hypothetical protein
MEWGSGNDFKHKAHTSDRGESCDVEADEDDVRTEVTTGDGKTYKNTLPQTSTVLTLKQQMERDLGFKPGQIRMFINDDSREEELEEGERLGSLRRGKGQALLITMIVLEPDAQEVVPRLAAEADLVVLGDGKAKDGDDQLDTPRGVAFVPAHPDWVVTTEFNGHRIKISNIRTGAVICKFGEEEGRGEGQFNCPYGVAVTSDSSFVVIAEYSNHRMKVLRLVAATGGSSAHLEFVRHIDNGSGSDDGQLYFPIGLVLLPGKRVGQETVLVTDGNHRVSQFKLDGSFLQIFAGTGAASSGDGKFNGPCGITVLGSSEEVAVADYNHRVQIFNSEGKYMRQFGSNGEEDGQFRFPSALASDVHGNLLVLDMTNRLQVFSPEGRHLCTRNDLGLDTASKGIAWSEVGELAAANGNGCYMRLWKNE